MYELSDTLIIQNLCTEQTNEHLNAGDLPNILKKKIFIMRTFIHKKRLNFLFCVPSRYSRLIKKCKRLLRLHYEFC